MNDTDPQIANLVRRRLLERSGAERILIGSRMFDVAKAMVLASFPGGLSEIEIKARLCERLYGHEVDISGFIQHLRSLEPTAPDFDEMVPRLEEQRGRALTVEEIEHERNRAPSIALTKEEKEAMNIARTKGDDALS